MIKLKRLNLDGSYTLFNIDDCEKAYNLIFKEGYEYQEGLKC